MTGPKKFGVDDGNYGESESERETKRSVPLRQSCQGSGETMTWILTKEDRCDSCPSQAYVQVHMKTGHLTFCGHHYTKHAVVLEKVAHKIVNETERLLKRKEEGYDE